ncbi:BTB/POZ domain-containing protein KCTD19-like [Tachysurus vachellii]|uniref:BTB/POZ domain-containing protein KCTD19-like n=1 Tax=Tachysurus vachellii TaxID=175792 RepID=UPI00296AC5D3|nr:BTB/POZ domain-containing protein KCTD19-like [Tachysurus vachellii]
MEEVEESCSFNVGGCVFSIHLNRLNYFKDSLLLKSVRGHGDNSTLFIDRDASAFRHVYHYINTGNLTSSCVLEMNILHELAAGLHLTALQQGLENLLQLTDCICASDVTTETKRSVYKVMPQGLVSAPLVDINEEVLYCFVLLEQAYLHPGLINHDNLLWLCEDVAVIKCNSHLFRFIANFLQSGKILLPEMFSEHGELCEEARTVGMTEFIKMLQELSDWRDGSSSSDSYSEGQRCCAVEPVYVLSLSLLVQYPDSSLGQLCVDSNLKGNRLYITGTGVLFQHVENWLGTSRLPLTTTAEELPSLCAYLDSQDGVYLAIREAMREFLHRRETTGYMSAMSWSASVSTFTLYKVVKVYAGTYWYATYFKTIIKHPELLANSNKSKWMVFGESLLVQADGQMFRHILNFLRCGRLLLPLEFREWPLLFQEIEAFQIPALTSALQNCADYRAWCKARTQAKNLFTSCKDEDILYSSLTSEKSSDEYEPPSFQKESPDNTFLSSETSSTHTENEAVCVSVSASGITEVRPAATEKTERTEEIPLTSVMCHSPPATAVSSSSRANEKTMIKNSSKLLPVSTMFSGRKGISEDYWNREMAFILHMLRESRKKEDSPQLERLAILMETSVLSRSKLMQLLSQLSDREKSALGLALVTTFSNSWQNCKEQQQSSDMGNTQKENTHTEERPQHYTHMHRQHSQNPSRDQGGRGSVFPMTSFTLPVCGCVLTVEHPAVLGRGEAGGYFTHSVIYTDEQPQLMQSDEKKGNDVAFAYFSMSYEEMIYARECHAFLTGTILDARRLDPNDCIIKLVYDLWTGHMGADSFVQELLTTIRVRPHKKLEKQEKLLQWVKFTLPLAKRYTECVRELLRKTSLHTVSLLSPDLLEVTISTQKVTLSSSRGAARH